MESEDDIERTEAFDELLRGHGASQFTGEIDSKRMQTIRLLHEVFRAEGTPLGSSVDAETPLPVSVGRFQVQRMLGRGGFGTVYLAADPLLNRLVALKLIHGHLLLDPAIRQRALREREAMARLQHPNIVPVWEAGEDRDQLFIISEYCSGQTLAEYLAEHPEPMDGIAAARWAVRLADAVAHSHQRGVIHRDLKPGNILLDPLTQPTIDKSSPQFEPRLSDFGLAKILDNSTANSDSAPTQAGLFVGSLEYASPEQVKGQTATIGTASDIYALGVLLFQLLTGRLPHSANSQYELARRICEEDARFPTDFLSTVPRDLQAITLRAMARRPSDRYASAEALREDLARYLSGQPVAARPVSLFELTIRLARKRPAITALASTCCLLSLMYLYMLIISNDRLSRQSQALKVALQHANEQRAEAEHQRLRAEAGQKSLNKLLYRESIKLAFDQWQQQNYIGLHDSLQRLGTQTPSTLELQYLQQQLGSTYFKFDLQGEPVQAIAWHPGHQQIFGISPTGRLRSWQPDRAAAVREHQTAIGAHSLAIHPSGETLALPQFLNPKAKTSNITLWNAVNAIQLNDRWQSHTTTVESLEFSPDGRWLAAGPRYSNVIITDLENEDSFAIRSNRRNRQVVFSPESDRIAVYTAIGKIEIIELATRSVATTIVNRFGSEPVGFYSMAWVPGHNAIVANARPERLQIYSAVDGKRMADAHAGLGAENIAVSPDGRRVVLGDSLGCIRLFDLQALLDGAGDDAATADDVSITPSMRVLNGKITDIAFIDNESIVAADEEGNMMRLLLPKPQPNLVFHDSCRQLQWHDDQHLWVYDYEGKSVRYVQTDAHRLELLADSPKHVDREIARAQSATRTAMVAMDGAVTIVDSQTGQQVSKCQLPRGKTTASRYPVCDRILFSADGQTLFATGENNQVTATRVADGTIVWSNDLTNSGYCLAEDTARRKLFLGGGFEAFKTLDSTNGQLMSEYVAGHGTVSALVNTSGEYMLSGHNDGTVRKHGLRSDEPPSIHRVSTTGISAMTMTPDLRTLVTGDDAGVLRLADDDIVTYGILYRSKLPSAQVANLKWSPNGQTLAALVFSTQDNISELVIFENGLPAHGQ